MLVCTFDDCARVKYLEKMISQYSAKRWRNYEDMGAQRVQSDVSGEAYRNQIGFGRVGEAGDYGCVFE